MNIELRVFYSPAAPNNKRKLKLSNAALQNCSVNRSRRSG